MDIDSSFYLDIVCDARKLATLPASEFDAVYCSHNLEHYFRHDGLKVLQGFLHVLKDDGFAHIKVPDIQKVMQSVVANGTHVFYMKSKTISTVNQQLGNRIWQ